MLSKTVSREFIVVSSIMAELDRANSLGKKVSDRDAKGSYAAYAKVLSIALEPVR